MSHPQYPSGPQQPHGPHDHESAPGEPRFGPPPGDQYGAPHYGDPHQAGQQYGEPGYAPPPQGDPLYGHQQGGPQYGPPPKQGMSTGGKVALAIGGSVGLIVIVVLVVAIAANLADGGAADPAAPVAQPSAQEEAPAEQEPAPDQPAEEPASAQGVTMTATDAGTTGDALDESAVYTVVDIEIVNDSDESIEVNPIYFTMTLSDGSSVNDWADTLFADIEPIMAGSLAPGDSTSGQIAVVGEVEIVQVELGDLIGEREPVVADVR
ncbi:DUF4352 domain-containing protein [Nocardiopsis sp. NPDC050513]|uniref:DUF4352 domain-containing protein n=1 Tax=Nocardiopsis sp. NPDC050513 TaxID=3364338 RepID=UPI0037A7FEDE